MLTDIINDEHYKTKVLTALEGLLMIKKYQGQIPTFSEALRKAEKEFDARVHSLKGRFCSDGSGRYFGSLAVHIAANLWLVSPREKEEKFSSYDAVIITNISGRDITATGKASLNAPLLIKTAIKHQAKVATHLHEKLADTVPTVPYAPPGTVRDNDRDIPGPEFMIKGHGFIQTFTEFSGK